MVGSIGNAKKRSQGSGGYLIIRDALTTIAPVTTLTGLTDELPVRGEIMVIDL